MLSHIARARSRTAPLAARPLAGVAVVLALIVAWLGQSAIIGVHSHGESPHPPHAPLHAGSSCDHGPSDRKTPARPASDTECRVCMLAGLAAANSAPPIQKPLTLPSAPGRIFIESVTPTPPSVETPGVPLGRGPPLA